MLLSLLLIAQISLGLIVGIANWEIIACRILAIVSGLTILAMSYELGKRMKNE